MDPDGETDLASVKLDINNLLWKHLPGSAAIADAERIAVRWFDDVVAARHKASSPSVAGMWADAPAADSPSVAR